jgi:hypothetical protein
VKDIQQSAQFARAFKGGITPILLFPTAFVNFLIFPFAGISGTRLGFYIVPPHVFCSFSVGPDIFAGDGAGMAADALVKMKDHRNLRSDIHNFTIY